MKTLPTILVAGAMTACAAVWSMVPSAGLMPTAAAATQPRDLPAGMTKADRDILGVVMAMGPEIVPASAPFYIVDGDTFDVLVRPKKRWELPLRIRVKNINTPETRGYKCTREKDLARQAKEFATAELMKPGAEIVLTDLDGFDDNGRYLAQVQVNGSDLGERMIKEGLARRWTDQYEGQTKDFWCTAGKGR